MNVGSVIIENQTNELLKVFIEPKLMMSKTVLIGSNNTKNQYSNHDFAGGLTTILPMQIRNVKFVFHDTDVSGLIICTIISGENVKIIDREIIEITNSYKLYQFNHFFVLQPADTLALDKNQCAVTCDGERGPQGEIGPPGIQGLTGPVGRQGPTGPRCHFKTPKWINLDLLETENFHYVKTTLESGKQLLFVKHDTNVWGAMRVCEAVCGRLFLPISSEENEQAASFIQTQHVHYVWLRASDKDQEGMWRDLENEMVEVKYTNWGKNEPNDSNSEEFAILGASGHWNDFFHGETKLYFKVKILCELFSAL